MSKDGKITRALAMDCEMVGTGLMGRQSMLARVSLVNEECVCVYDTFVKPTKPVTNYRYAVSGVTPNLLASGLDFDIVQNAVAKLLQGRILVGHSLEYDFEALGLYHPECDTRDTATYPPFQTGSRTFSLKKLAARHLAMNIQNGSHSSIEDAKAVMMLYKLKKNAWEDWLQKGKK